MALHQSSGDAAQRKGNHAIVLIVASYGFTISSRFGVDENS
jgi:hypothetical protein